MNLVVEVIRVHPAPAAQENIATPARLELAAPEQAPPSTSSPAPAPPPPATAPPEELAFATKSWFESGEPEPALEPSDDGASEPRSLTSRKDETDLAEKRALPRKVSSLMKVQWNAERTQNGTVVPPESSVRRMTDPASSRETFAATLEQASGNVPKSTVSREISVQIPTSGNQSIEVRIIERNGNVHVTVHSDDRGLTQSLRSELQELVRVLEDRGFRTETWTPPETRPSRLVESAQSESANHRGGSSSGDGSGGGGRGQSSRQQQQRSNKPKWVAELEARLERTAAI